MEDTTPKPEEEVATYGVGWEVEVDKAARREEPQEEQVPSETQEA